MRKQIAVQQEAYPLQWPEGWVRTRPQDRRDGGSWKKTLKQSTDALIRELEKMGAKSVVISTNVPLTPTGGMDLNAPEPRDTGVAVYFVRKEKEDFSWQDILEVRSPAPTLEEIDAAYRVAAKKYHPDNQQTGNKEVFVSLVGAVEKARAYVKGETVRPFVLACDTFKSVRWNLTAIRLTVGALRTIDRTGCTGMTDGVFKGLRQITANAEATS